MLRRELLNIILLILYLISLIVSNLSGQIWVTITQACLLLSCYSRDNESLKHNFVLALVLIGICSVGLFKAPTVLVAVLILLFVLIYSITKNEKAKISTQFLAALLVIGLVFEYFSPGSLYYFSLNQTIYLFMFIGALISLNTFSVHFGPAVTLTLYCIGASFEQIQLYILLLLFIETLRNNFKNISKLSLLLLIWMTPAHPWAICLYVLYVLPEFISSYVRQKDKHISMIALVACLSINNNLAIKIVIVSYLLFCAVQLTKDSKRVADA